MSSVWSVSGNVPITVNPRPLIKDFTDDEFFEFCQLNKDLRIERTAEGDLIIMPPTGGETAIRNSTLNYLFAHWARQDGSGKTFDSSAGFTLPNGAKRSPDLSWVSNQRWQKLTPEEREKFPPLCPDFVVELLSESDSLTDAQDKMTEYMANGAQLGWLIDPFARTVYVYRKDAPLELLQDPKILSGEPLLPGLAINIAEVWD
jgi:Uma2 family endonuclease